MAIPWNSNVKAAGQLTVYDALTSGNWVHIFKIALQLFNGLGLPVKMTQAKDEESANVVMKVSTVDGKRLHGNTQLFHAQGGPLEKAIVVLPNDPQSSAGFIRGKEVVERASLDMMKVIAVHELIHACGLENNDHATDDGVFYFPLAPSGTGKLIVPAQGKNDRPMPPLRLAQSTVGKVASLWQ